MRDLRSARCLLGLRKERKPEGHDEKEGKEKILDLHFFFLRMTPLLSPKRMVQLSGLCWGDQGELRPACRPSAETPNQTGALLKRLLQMLIVDWLDDG
jgi:hypothetical protein